MRLTRIDFEGRAGSATIQRDHREGRSDFIRIDSILRDPKGEQAWTTWENVATTGNNDLFNIAQILQRRCDGEVGTGSDIQKYYREIQRFSNA